MAQVCSRCGEPVGAEDRFCGRCGLPLPSVAASPPRARRRSLRLVLWIALPLAALLAVLALTNPSPRAYSRWLAAEVSRHGIVAIQRLPPGRLATLLARASVAQNDVIFTIFDTRIRRVQFDVLGIFDHFIPLGTSSGG